MAKVLLIQPWNFHDEGIKKHDLSHEWRNGPYSLLMLATQLKAHNHQVFVLDMMRDLVVLRGDVEQCLNTLFNSILRFKPDIIGFSFFSIHFLEVKKAVETARKACTEIGIRPIFIAGGIHATIEPQSTIRELGFDYAFIGEADLGILQLAYGCAPRSVRGVVDASSESCAKGKEVHELDSLPFPDWSLCDYKFYAYPSYGKLRTKKASCLDMMMGRGCVYRCSFCAYSALSRVRFHSAEYLFDQMRYMTNTFKVDGIYFTDSSIGNNRQLLREFCELMIREKRTKPYKWYGNIRSNQVNEDLLKLMWRAGCRFLFYGFESGSQRVLDLMNKKVKIDDNYKVVSLHHKLRFPFHASMIFGYPGEKEEDLKKSIQFIKHSRATNIGINWYVPLPGSRDYEKLRQEGAINTDNPLLWRRIGEVNFSQVYADIPEQRFRELFSEAVMSANEGRSGAAKGGFLFPGTVTPYLWRSRMKMKLDAVADKFIKPSAQ